MFTEKVWKVALDTGANVLALNVLEAEGSGDREISNRNSLNSKIANHQQERLYVHRCYSSLLRQSIL